MFETILVVSIVSLFLGLAVIVIKESIGMTIVFLSTVVFFVTLTNQNYNHKTNKGERVTTVSKEIEVKEILEIPSNKEIKLLTVDNKVESIYPREEMTLARMKKVIEVNNVRDHKVYYVIYEKRRVTKLGNFFPPESFGELVTEEDL